MKYLIPLLFLAMNVAHAQPGPTPRASGHLIFHPPTKSLWLFDGYGPGLETASGLAEIWSWNGESWKKIDSVKQPFRSLSAAAWLPDRRSVFIFGGIGDKGYDDSLSTTLLYDGKRWHTSTGEMIGTRDHHDLAYDEARQAVVVFGGQNSKREFDTVTWIYHQDKWSSLAIPGPGARVHHAMAYDANRKRVVLFGGYDTLSSLRDTWEFDGTAWIKMESNARPSGRGHHAMVYNPVIKKVMLFGGMGEPGPLSDIWTWDGMDWELLAADGPARLLAQIAFDPDTQKLFLFGGNGGEQGTDIYSDLWEWNGHQWKQLYKGQTYRWNMSNNQYMLVQ